MSIMTGPRHPVLATEEISEFSWVFGQSVDRLVTVEMRPVGLPYGKIDRLLDAARSESGFKSQTLVAAQALRRAVTPGDAVFIVTGAGTPPFIPKGENDGPIGAAALARAVLLGLGAVPVYLCEQHHLDPIVASSEAAGVPIRPDGTEPRSARGAFAECAPTAEADVPGWAAAMFGRYSPAAVIFIERLGPNRRGVIHGSTGISGWSPMVDLTPILSEATSRGIVSIGIGDAGNEIGFGRIFDAVREIQESGAVCQCSCQDGMATVTCTDILVVASVSNWGAYAIEASLAHLIGREELPQTEHMARRVIDACFAGGGYEAVFCTQRDLVDGIAAETSVALTQILREMVRISLLPPDAGPAH
jgi:D-glutamate cyclase